MATGGSRRSPGSINKIIVVVLVIGLVGTFIVLQYYNLYGNTSGGLTWKLKLTFVDSRFSPARNYTLPAGIGVPNGYWANHTLDRFGVSGHSPLTTNDTSSRIWIQTNTLAYFTFGDFFNIWGKPLNQTCVPDLTNGGTYCARAADPIIYDVNNDGTYEPGIDYDKIPLSSILPVQLPPAGATLKFDQNIKFVNSSNTAVWNSNEAIIYDPDHDGIYNNSTDTVLFSPNGSPPPSNGVRTQNDPKLRFYDWNLSGHWDAPVPPPVMSDGANERCVTRAPALSNNKDWLIFYWSNLASSITGACVPGF